MERNLKSLFNNAIFWHLIPVQIQNACHANISELLQIRMGTLTVIIKFKHNTKKSCPKMIVVHSPWDDNSQKLAVKQRQAESEATQNWHDPRLFRKEMDESYYVLVEIYPRKGETVTRISPPPPKKKKKRGEKEHADKSWWAGQDQGDYLNRRKWHR